MRIATRLGIAPRLPLVSVSWWSGLDRLGYDIAMFGYWGSCLLPYIPLLHFFSLGCAMITMISLVLSNVQYCYCGSQVERGGIRQQSLNWGLMGPRAASSYICSSSISLAVCYRIAFWFQDCLWIARGFMIVIGFFKTVQSFSSSLYPSANCWHRDLWSCAWIVGLQKDY